MSKTKIEWTDATWNPVTGCTKVSAGCEHCYAERMSKRLAGRCGYPKDDPFRVTLHAERLTEPLHWKKPHMVFVCSMGDLFHEDVPSRFIQQVFDVGWECKNRNLGHIFQFLTKRPHRMATEYRKWLDSRDASIGASYHWLGTSIEDQATADERIPYLLQCPAAVRFISYEPAIEPVDLNRCELLCKAWSDGGATIGIYLDWVIAGGESGPGARPAHPDWFRTVRDQCVETRTPFFFKQWGEWVNIPPVEMQNTARPAFVCRDCGMSGDLTDEAIGAHRETGCCGETIAMYSVGKKRAGRLLDGRTWDEMPRQQGARNKI